MYLCTYVLMYQNCLCGAFMIHGKDVSRVGRIRNGKCVLGRCGLSRLGIGGGRRK